MDDAAEKKRRREQDEDLMQLTLQLRNKKENDEKYAKFHGDNLIGVSASHFFSLSFATNGPHRIQLFPRLACGKM